MTLSSGTGLGPYEIVTSTQGRLGRLTGAEDPEGPLR